MGLDYKLKVRTTNASGNATVEVFAPNYEQSVMYFVQGGTPDDYGGKCRIKVVTQGSISTLMDWTPLTELNTYVIFDGSYYMESGDSVIVEVNDATAGTDVNAQVRFREIT